MRSEEGVTWLANFYPIFTRLRARAPEEEEEDDRWSLHSSDLDWSDTEKDEERLQADTKEEKMKQALMGPM